MQATRLVSRAAAPLARSGIPLASASTPYASTSNALPPSISRRNASTIALEEMQIPVLSAAAETTTTSKKGKGRAPSQRELPLRKQFLMQQYKEVLSNSPVIIFLKPSDFSIEEITRLRVDLSLIKSKTNNASSKENDINDVQNSKPKYLFMRAGLLPPLFKEMKSLEATPLLQHLKQHGSNIAALTFPSLDPPTLKSALKAINKLSKTPNARKAQAEAAAKGPAAGKAKGPAVPTVQEERLKIITALVEGKSLNPQEITKLSELPSLEQTLAQLVAVIETPARQIYSMISRAQGQDLVRTLEGFKVGLEEKEKPTDA